MEEKKSGSDRSIESEYEQKLCSLIETLDGVSQVSVMITVDRYSDNSSPIVRGVSVICHGKQKEELKIKITLLVSTALGISSDKIFVTFD